MGQTNGGGRIRVGISTSSFGASDTTPLESLEAAGVDVVPNPYGRRLSREEAIAFVSDLDGLIAGLEPLDRGVLESTGRLKAIARVGIGMDNVDQDAARELGIAVSNTPEPPTIAVAELTLTAMLCLLRDFQGSSASLRAGEWRKEIQGSLDGANVHIVGFGRIGRRVAMLAQAFGAKVLATDPFLSSDQTGGVPLVGLREGLEVADVVSVHAAGADTLIGAPELALMKPSAVLLNAARGSLVDEVALEDALSSGRLAAAWFDAFWEEPYAGNLLRQRRFFGTPHVATYTGRCRLTMESRAVGNLLRDLGVGGEE